MKIVESALLLLGNHFISFIFQLQLHILLFSGCTVNIGNGFIPKSGVFQCPEPGLYMFNFTVCTYDGKKCLMMLKKNDMDVCALIDQDGNENRGKTMISQTCMLELDVSDRIQVKLM